MSGFDTLISTGSTESLHQTPAPSPLATPMNESPTSTAPSSPVHYQLASGPGSAPSTPSSSRPPSPLLKAMASLSMTSTTQKPTAGRPRQPSSSNGSAAPSRRQSFNVSAPPSRRPSFRTQASGAASPALQPFLAKFEPLDVLVAKRFAEQAEEAARVGSGTRQAREMRLEKVCVIGSGSWGTALARLAAVNVAEQDGFDETVNMWVRQREIPGKGLLTDVINETHENARYLPQMTLPDNLVAVPSLTEVVKDATLIIFCVPHQFLPPVISELARPGVLTPGARAISAIKGIEVDLGTSACDIYTYPSIIEKQLRLPCSALGGANIAHEVASEELCETTIGVPSPIDATLWHAVFDSPMFRVHCVEDVAGVSLSGALKNVVALAAGFVDGMDLGGNTKAAILRVGLVEMASFTLEFFPSASPTTFSHHSAGVADLITTSFGGRNRKCAEAFVRTRKSFDELEKELLNGQKLQGTVTAEEIYRFLEGRGRIEGYPLFSKVYRIAFEGVDPRELFTDL